MISVFTTKANLEDIFQKEENKAWQAIILKLNEVFINDDPFSECDESNPDDDVFLTLDSIGVKLKDDERNFIDNIPKNPESVLNHPCGIYLLDISEAIAHQIQEDYGVICQSIGNLNDKPLTQNHFSNELNEDSNGLSWSKMFAPFKQLPSNSLLIIDSHLFDNDRFNEKENVYDSNRSIGLDNLCDIISALLPNQFEEEYHIGVLLTDYDVAKAKGIVHTNLTNKRISKAIHRLKERLVCSFKDRLIIEVFFFDCRDDRHRMIHNRRILSNYFIITADYRLAAIKNGRSTVDQSITVFPLFESINSEPDSDKKEKRISYEIRKFKEFFISQTRSAGPTALFLQNNRAMDDFNDIKNRLIKIS